MELSNKNQRKHVILLKILFQRKNSYILKNFSIFIVGWKKFVWTDNFRLFTLSLQYVIFATKVGRLVMKAVNDSLISGIALLV